MYNKDLNAQYVIMDEKTENGFIPDYDELIAEAPNDEMKAKWIASKELHQRLAERDAKLGGFAFNSVYMIEMKCGHYEIFQHMVRDETDLVEWIALMQSDKHYKECTRCICG